MLFCMNSDLNLEAKRHSLAHLLAAAVLRLYPDSRNTLGPAIENGFYYDFDFLSPISERDLTKIENKMREISKSWKGFAHKEVTTGEAEILFEDNPYKLELIKEIDSR